MVKRAKRKPTKAVADKPLSDYAPTAEAFQHGDFERAGIAYRRRPVIDVLKDREVLTMRQWIALGRYRDLFDQTERSPQRDSCDVGIRGGETDGPSMALLRAKSERYALERELGSLRPIAEAIAGNDMTLSQWAIRQAGTKERKLFVGGKLVATYYEAKTHSLKVATVDIRMAGERLAAALAA